jgi:hypothetical protein
METLVVESWNAEMAWDSDGSWSRSNLEDRLRACTRFQPTELKRLARKLLAREPVEFSITGREIAESAAHILESMGATVRFRSGAP